MIYRNNWNVDKLIDPIDELFGALGAFTFKVAVSGVILSNYPMGHFSIIINKFCVYVKDSYDFTTNFEYLGCWNEQVVSKIYECYANFRVYNSDFREYRRKYNKGGDFLVFSDAKIFELEKQITKSFPVSLAR